MAAHTVTGHATFDGTPYTATASFTVNGGTGPTKIVGMSSPASLWDQRLAEVGRPGITARRIYADVSANGISNMSLIQDAIAAGMTPCVSFKFGSGTIAKAGNGDYNQWVQAAANQLQALGVPILVACWHEPFDDMSGPEFLAIQRQVLPILNAKSNLSTFCILHGWLLDNLDSRFTAYMAPDVFAMLTYFGIDSYQSGTNASPGNNDLSTRMPTLLNYLSSMGDANKPLIIGEFSAYTAASMNAIGNTILTTPNVKYALEFNSQTGGKGEPLVPNTTRMTAFQNLKADSRVRQ